MNYQVLARKWRPSNFTEVVGQEHVVKSLMNALQHERLHHAYLFTGTRGIGKTTIARILAKAINCDHLAGFNPCGQCQSCRELDEGRFLDLIEVDAASRTKVEDTRDLLDNVQYAPNYGRYKVYLIDEVHMLSGHSFNALLKTLEEPPPHVKFLLATTDPQKIPVTVLSRCLQLNLKRLSSVQISNQLDSILKQEQIAAESQAIHILSRAADGSIRDGLSLLDQAIVHGGGQVTAASVNAMLGTVALHSVEQLLIALVEGNANAVLDHIAEIANTQSDFSTVLQQLLQVIHRIALAQKVPDWDDHELDKEIISALAKRFSPEDVQLYYQIALLGQKDFDVVPDSRMGFEMIMLRMLAFKPVTDESKPLTAKQAHSGHQPSSINEGRQPTNSVTIKSSENLGNPLVNHSWVELIALMKLEGLTRELANNCLLEQIDDDVCQLTLDSSHQQLLTANSEKKLRQALQDFRGTPLKLSINIAQPDSETPAMQAAKAIEDKQQAAVDAINADATINALKEHFDARIIPGSIQPQ
ncbi:DNA polymerase III subunit gamma/tau [biofilm metagenome]